MRVKLPNSLTSIGDAAFLSCPSLASINIPTGVTSIGLQTFCGSGLTSIKVPANVKSIGEEAFRACYSLEDVDLSEFQGTIGACAFNWCSNVKNFILSEDNPNCYVSGTGIYTSDHLMLSHFTPEGGRLVIPYPVKDFCSRNYVVNVYGSAAPLYMSWHLSSIEFPCSWNPADRHYSNNVINPDTLILRFPYLGEYDRNHLYSNEIYVFECDSATTSKKYWGSNIHVLRLPESEMMVEEFVRNNGIYNWASIVENAPGYDVVGYYIGKAPIQPATFYPQYFSGTISDASEDGAFYLQQYYSYVIENINSGNKPIVGKTVECVNGKAFELENQSKNFANWFLEKDTIFANECNKNFGTYLGDYSWDEEGNRIWTENIEEVKCDDSYGVPNNTYWRLLPDGTTNPKLQYFLHMVPNMPYRIHALFAPNIDTIEDDWGYCKVKCTLNINTKNETGEIMPLESDEIDFRTDRMMDVVLFDGVYTPNFTNNSIEIQSIPKPAEIRKGYLREIPLIGFWAEPLEEYDLSTGMKPVWQPPYAKDDDAIYNLNGQKIVAPQKGIYIQNGRKMLKQ